LKYSKKQREGMADGLTLVRITKKGIGKKRGRNEVNTRTHNQKKVIMHRQKTYNEEKRLPREEGKLRRK